LHTTDEDIAHRTKVNAIRQAKLMEVVQPCTTRPPTLKELLSTPESQIIHIPQPINSKLFKQDIYEDDGYGDEEDENENENENEEEERLNEKYGKHEYDLSDYRLKVNIAMSPEPTFQELSHIKLAVGKMEEYVLPRDIALAFANLKAATRSSIETNRTGGENEPEDGDRKGRRSRTNSDELIDVAEIPEDDGIPSYENPFASLFGKCKPVPMFEMEIDATSTRPLGERYLMHEQIRAALTTILPEYREAGKTAINAARDLMVELVKCPEEPGRELDVEELLNRDIDDRRVHAIALLQAFIDRCETECW